MSANYTYYFFLDSITETPFLAERATQVDTHSPQYRVYRYTQPASFGANLINSMVEHVLETCDNYKLIVLGEHEGHMEIYKSEDYSGDLGINVVNTNYPTINVWKSE